MTDAFNNFGLNAIERGEPLAWVALILLGLPVFIAGCAYLNTRLIAWLCAHGHHDPEWGPGSRCIDCGKETPE